MEWLILAAIGWLGIGFSAGCQYITALRGMTSRSLEPEKVYIFLFVAALSGLGAVLSNMRDGSISTAIDWPFAERRNKQP